MLNLARGFKKVSQSGIEGVQLFYLSHMGAVLERHQARILDSMRQIYCALIALLPIVTTLNEQRRTLEVQQPVAMI